MKLTVANHPLLAPRAFVTEFPAALEASPSPDSLLALLALDATAPLRSDDAVRETVRALLRHGGFKPTGRNKPAAEYLVKAATEGRMPKINLAVDACNVVSLHSGLPISVVDLDHVRGEARLDIAPAGSQYVFNASGQVIELAGLLCLFDDEGPCANAVKDAQRTKTSPATRRTLSVLWGSRDLGDRPARAEAWYRELLNSAGARTEDVTWA